MIAAGERAPDFTLRDQDGQEVSLADFRGGKVLIVFYPLDFSPVCSDQLSVYQEVKPEIEAKGVKMIGISVDSGFAHKAFQEKLGIDTQLLADFEPKGEVARAYGAYMESGHTNRSLVLIDAEGTVEWVYESPTPLDIPGANLIFDALAA
jgi:Peroxiredoxin